MEVFCPRPRPAPGAAFVYVQVRAAQARPRPRPSPWPLSLTALIRTGARRPGPPSPSPLPLASLSHFPYTYRCAPSRPALAPDALWTPLARPHPGAATSSLIFRPCHPIYPSLLVLEGLSPFISGALTHLRLQPCPARPLDRHHAAPRQSAVISPSFPGLPHRALPALALGTRRQALSERPT